MMNENRIEIPLSNNKLFLIILGSFVFVILGIWLFTSQETIFRKGVGITAILFFGVTGIYGIIKLFDRKMGLIIDSNGIFDNSSGASVGYIKWEDIKGFRTGKVYATEFLLIDIHNPDEYISKVSSKRKALLLKSTLKMYGTPISIGSVSLKIKFRKLEHLLVEQFEKNKNVR